MQLILTQLQGFNVTYKLLDYYWEQTNSEDVGCLAGGMLFFPGGGTADPAIWHDWLDAIKNKKLLSKQEAFDAMIKFLDIYRKLGESGDITSLINKLNTAKNCNDKKVPLIKQWNFYLKKVLNEPEDTREYLDFGDPMQNIPPIIGFNTIYKLLDYYSKQKKSVDIARMANNMLFLPDGCTVDSAAWPYWMKSINNKLISTRQEVFEGAIRLLEMYGDKLSFFEAKSIAKELRSAKNSEDFNVPLVELWNFCLVESLNEPGGSRKYFTPIEK